MPPLLCRILILRKISSDYVSNNEGQNFPRGGPKSYPFANFQYSTLTGLLVPTALSRRKFDHILGIFKYKRMILLLRNYHSFQVQIVDTSLFLKTPCVELEVSTSKTQKTEFYQAQGANFVTFFSNLGLFKAKSRSNLSVMNN